MKQQLKARARRAKRTRMKIKALSKPRLSIHRSNNHIYGQIISETGDKVITAASSLDKSIQAACPQTGNREAAQHVGKVLGQKALKAGIKSVAFDRSGFKYHGRVKAFAEAAREVGLEF